MKEPLFNGKGLLLISLDVPSNYTIHIDACFSAKKRCVSRVRRLQPILIAQVRLLVIEFSSENPVTETLRDRELEASLTCRPQLRRRWRHSHSCEQIWGRPLLPRLLTKQNVS